MPTSDRRLLADLLMSAATELTLPETQDPSPLLQALGVRVTRGRLTLSRAAFHLPETTVSVVVGFNIAAWLGDAKSAPRFPHESHAERTALMTRGRVGLSKTVRMWLCVPDREQFDVIPVPAKNGGLFLIPVHDYTRRWEEVERVAH